MADVAVKMLIAGHSGLLDDLVAKAAAARAAGKFDLAAQIEAELRRFFAGCRRIGILPKGPFDVPIGIDDVKAT